jgi:scyllo-inositol 2-dehydrogenase (NADP+)
VNESARLKVLALCELAERPLLEYLERSDQLNVEVANDRGRLRDLGAFGAVLLLCEEALEPEQERAVLDFVRAGGGLVAGHSSLHGLGSPRRAPATELVLAPVAGSPLTDRLPAEFKVRGELVLSEPAPEGSTVLLTTSWRYEEVPVAYEQALGRGRLAVLGLAGGDVFTDPVLGRFIYRALRHTAGIHPAPAVGVGLLGYGAIAREHAEAVRQTAGLELRAACDRSSARRELAARELGVPAHGSAEDMLEDPSVELVVVGTPPNAHAGGVLKMLDAGRHVVCEKPFALRVGEVDRMMAAAAAAGRVLTVYQSRRWDPDFVAMREAVAAGRIGDLFYMESFIGGFSHPCSYWHSHEPISGGTIYDWGSHYFDWVLQLFGERRVAAVSASAHKRVWLDVTNADQVRVDLRFDDGAEAIFLQSDIAAALKPKWYLLGTAGAIQGDWRSETVKLRDATGALVEEQLAPAESPARLTVHSAEGHVQRLALPARDGHGFYGNLADHLLQGEPLAVRPEEARRNVAVMEAATRSIAEGGRRLEVSL